MLHVYEPFVLKRLAENRIFFVNSKMPFDYFLECFQQERPFFLVAQLEDGRLAITPNTMYFTNFWQLTGTWLPNDFEYVTMKESTYPLLITAHPVAIEKWLRKFEGCVTQFSKQTMAEFVFNCDEFIPITKGKEQRSIVSQQIPA